MPDPEKARQAAAQRKRDRSGKFAPEGKPAPAMPLGISTSIAATPQERAEEITASLYPGSAVSEQGEVITSESGPHSYSGLRAIEEPLRKALAVCENVMSATRIDECLDDAGADAGAVAMGSLDERPEADIGPDDAYRTLRDLARERRDLLLKKLQAELRYSGPGSTTCQYYDAVPFDEHDDLLDLDAQTMYYFVEPVFSGDGRGEQGVVLYVAGFDEFDQSTGVKYGWGQTSVFYALPDTDMAQEVMVAGAAAYLASY